MEKEISQRFSDAVLRAGASMYGVTLDQLVHQGSSMNFVYEYQKNDHAYILRFTPGEHRSLNLVKGELDWLYFLDKHGLSVSAPIESCNGNLVEVVEGNESYFIVTSFVKAAGAIVGYPDCLQDHDLYQKCGRMTGRLHALSKKYQPSDEAIRRKGWTENYYLRHLEQFIPADQVEVIDAAKRFISFLDQELPKDSESFGLTHGDIHVRNVCVCDEGATLFDFDEAQYSWFLDDIVPQLYYLVYVFGGDDGRADRESQAHRFMEHFMKGYLEENQISADWMHRIPLFLRLREIIVYVGMYKNHPDLSVLDQWGIDYLSEAKIRIEQGIPIVDIWT